MKKEYKNTLEDPLVRLEKLRQETKKAETKKLVDKLFFSILGIIFFPITIIIIIFYYLSKNLN